MEAIELDEVALSEAIKATKSFYEERYGLEKKPGIYSDYDWARISFVFDILDRGGAALDVGAGGGQLINTIARSGAFASATGIDVTKHTKFVRMTDDFEMLRMSVANMSFADDAFDVVICMEVLEHLDRPTMLAALGELRRICRNQLVMSVPFEEPEPLPSYHKQRFDTAAAGRLWPGARMRRLKKRGTHWLLLEERL